MKKINFMMALVCFMKPAELKQNFTWAVVKGFSAEGPLTYVIDKIYEIPPETQVNKNVDIYKAPK